jgi:hypothetical protein
MELSSKHYFYKIVHLLITLHFSQSFCKQKRIESDEASQQVVSEQPKKRSISSKKRCKIALVADHRFFKEIGNNNAQLTTLHMVSMPLSLVNWSFILLLF